MRIPCGSALLSHRVWQCPMLPSNAAASIHQIHLYRLAKSRGQKAAYSVTAGRSTRPNARPSSFVKDASSQFNKARHESMYLYKSFSSSSYIFGCYVSGILMITAGIYNHSTIAWANDKAIEEKQPLPSFIPVFTFVGSLFLVGFGCYIIFAKVHLQY